MFIVISSRRCPSHNDDAYRVCWYLHCSCRFCLRTSAAATFIIGLADYHDVDPIQESAGTTGCWSRSNSTSSVARPLPKGGMVVVVVVVVMVVVVVVVVVVMMLMMTIYDDDWHTLLPGSILAVPAVSSRLAYGYNSFKILFVRWSKVPSSRTVCVTRPHPP